MLSSQKIVNQNSFDKGFPYDNARLARWSYVNIFRYIQTQWSKLRSADKDVLCWYLFLSKTSSRGVIMKLKFKEFTLLLGEFWKGVPNKFTKGHQRREYKIS